MEKNERIASLYMTKERLTREVMEIVPINSPERGYMNTLAQIYLNGDMKGSEYVQHLEHIKTAVTGTWN